MLVFILTVSLFPPEANPDKFNNRIKNLLFYGKVSYCTVRPSFEFRFLVVVFLCLKLDRLIGIIAFFSTSWEGEKPNRKIN